MHPKKILFFDIDGTLVGPSRLLSERTREALLRARANGHRLILCTGRSNNYLTALLKEIPFDGYISNAGALVVCGSEIVEANFLKQAAVEQIIRVFQQYHICHDCECLHTDYIDSEMIRRIFYDPDEEKLADRIALFESQTRISPLSQYAKEPVLNISYCAEDPDALTRAAGELQSVMRITVNPSFSGKYIAGNLMQESVDKGTGIRALLRYMGADAKDTLGFGDSMGDLEMFETVHEAVVMENADEATKKHADVICPSVDDDGVFQELARRGWI